MNKNRCRNLYVYFIIIVYIISLFIVITHAHTINFNSTTKHENQNKEIRHNLQNEKLHCVLCEVILHKQIEITTTVIFYLFFLHLLCLFLRPLFIPIFSKIKHLQTRGPPLLISIEE